MKIFSIAIGEQYELESERLKRTVSNEIEVFNKSNNKYIQVNQDNRDSFTKALDNIKLTEMIYYLNEFESINIISNQSGIWKIKDKPVGASKEKLIQYFEQNPTEFEFFKEEVIKINQNKIYS